MEVVILQVLHIIISAINLSLINILAVKAKIVYIKFAIIEIIGEMVIIKLRMFINYQKLLENKRQLLIYSTQAS